MQDIPTQRPSTPILDGLLDPADLRALSKDKLSALAVELRNWLLYSVGQSGGHFGAGLGVVELTLALHYVFDTPRDSLVWDVGHQSYPHKILTGRRKAMLKVRHSDGPAPFPLREESPYDCFGVGHSSTSISAALGMALARQRRGDTSQTIAIIGDGGLTAGMAFEALNHAGECKPNLLIVLNDNAMSISLNVGALASGFANFFASGFYTKTRSLLKKTLQPLPDLAHLVRQVESHTKGLIIPPSALFEALDCQYFGPVDGHNLDELLHVCSTLKAIDGVRVLHLRTVKGKGFGKAESDPIGYHALSKTGAASEPAKAVKPTFSMVFGQWLCANAAKDDRLYAITPAMCEGSGMVEFARRFPPRLLDVGIAEQHALTLAAGMACQNIKPVVAIYSTFLQRAYDQLIHDICLQNLDVTLAIDRAGLVGEDGPTHHGVFDLCFMRCLPNLHIGVPADEAELYAMLSTAWLHPGPAAVRYPRGTGIGLLPDATTRPAKVEARVVLKGDADKPAILVFGTLLHQLRPLAQEQCLTLVNMRYLKPLDMRCLKRIAATHQHIAVVEDGAIVGGAGSAVAEALGELGWHGRLQRFGVGDGFVPHATRQQQLTACGLTPEAIARALFS